MMKQTMLALAGAAALGVGFTGSAEAVTFTETTDAGNTIPTAQILSSGTTSVLGEIESGQDTDLFRFTLDFASIFTIEVLEIDPELDMNLIVFDSLGRGLAGDDDDNSSCNPVTVLGSRDSCLTLSLASGDYFFAVGDNNMGAFESLAVFNSTTDFTSDFIDNDSGILGAPTTETLGLVGTESGPNDINDVGRYRVNFSMAVGGEDVESVPEPASMLGLLTIGAVAAGGALKKKVAA